MARGGRNIPTLQQAWALKGKAFVKLHRGQLVVQAWPKPYGPPRSQAQADTITAFKQIQRAMKSSQPQEYVDAITRTKGSGMYPRDYLFSCMSGNMHLLEYAMGGAVSAAVDRMQQFLSDGTATQITFAGIPPGYSALLFVGNGRLDAATTTQGMNINFNGDAGARYDSWRYDNNAGIFSAAGTAGRCALVNAANAPAGYASNFQITIPNYANTTFNKSWSFKGETQEALTLAGSHWTVGMGTWRSTAAINSVTIIFNARLVKASEITLYGLY